MIFNMTKPVLETLPQFTYTGTYELIDDGGGNWRIKFLTSGVLKFLKSVLIDAFLVGGGGSGPSYSGRGAGGGGGYTKTVKNITLTANTQYTITIGAGGAVTSADTGNTGGSTTAFGNTAAGGLGGNTQYGNPAGKGGDGGSGGGASNSATNGGSDGSNGANYGTNYTGGTGQGTTTREFGEESGDLYSGGGAGAYSSTVYGVGGDGGGGTLSAGKENTGGGGSGGRFAGGSGIVIIRKHKEDAA